MTNRLRLYTEDTGLENEFLVRWMAGLDVKGAVQVRLVVPVEDGRIAAELAAARWLLEEKNVSGHDKAGAGLYLYFSNGAVKKLRRGESSKRHLIKYAEFLWTRFLGASIDVETHNLDWIDFDISQSTDLLEVGGPLPELISVHGAGDVALTPYFVQRYIERFSRKPTRAWREIRALLSNPSLQPVSLKRRRVLEDVKHRSAGEYFYLPKRAKTSKNQDLPKREMIVVLTRAGTKWGRELLTVYEVDYRLQKRITSIPKSADHTSQFFQPRGRQS